MEDPSKLETLPVTYQAINDYYGKYGQANPFALRKETFIRVQKITDRPLICYVTKTHNLPQGVPSYIDDSDLTGFGDLIRTVDGDEVDIFIESNGGSAEATERIVRLLRERFKIVRLLIPANAYSAATLLSFAADEIVMDSLATLGPIDPQINGVPARAILRAFETVEGLIKREGPRALTAYMPLIAKYDLHILEICKSVQDLSNELAKNWLSSYMLRCADDDPRVIKIVEFFSNYDIHKSHGRSIYRGLAKELGLKVVHVEEIDGLSDLLRSLYNQYELFFDKTPFYKLFENAYGIAWGRHIQSFAVPLPSPMPGGAPPPMPPQAGHPTK